MDYSETVFDQLVALETVPNAYSNWKNYRNKLSDFILANTEMGSKALIIGAGPCNDFDLCRLSEHFSEVGLLDWNSSVVEIGIKNQGAKKDRIHIFNQDLVGISKQDYRNLCIRMEKEISDSIRTGKANRSEISEKYISWISELFNSRKPDPILMDNEAADHIICIGFHSQLLNYFPRIALVYSRYTFLDLEKIFSKIKEMNHVLCPEITDNLFQIAKHTVILGLEKQRIGMAGEIEGASQAMHSLGKYNSFLNRRMELVWPFDLSTNKQYEMEIRSYSACF